MTRSIRFGDWVWDPNTLELRHGSHVATLEPRVAQLLEYLVTHPGELLSHDRIVEAVWDGRVVSDEAVRRAVFSLRQALAVGGADSYIRTVHKKGYVAAFPAQVAANQEAICLPASGTTPQDVAGPARIATSPRLAILLKMAGVIALVVAALTRFDTLWEREPAATHSEVPAKGPAAIAVLPFANRSEEANSDFLADGLAEELLGALARNRGLRVTAPSSAFQFKGQDLDVRDVGRRLGVRYVLEGSVRRSGEQVRIHARLVDTDTGTQLWTEAYDRTLADWSVLEQDVASAVARALETVLPQGGESAALARGGTTNVEAHLEVLQARQLLATRSLADAEQAIEHLQRALTLDPNYALAYARLADAILIQAESTTSVKKVRPVVAPLLDKALALDPGLGEAYALRSLLTDDPAVAELDLRRGLDLNPSYARGYELLASLQAASLQQVELAVDSIDSAIALDPLTPGNFHTKAMLMMAQGYWPASAELERRALELNPEFRAAIVQLGVVNAVQGNFAEAVGYAERAVAMDPRAVSLRDSLVLIYLALGDIDSAAAVNASASVFGRLLIPWAEGDIGQAAEIIYSGKLGPLIQFSPEAVSQIMLVEARADQDFDRAVALLSPALPFADSLPAQVSGWRLYAYANLVQLLAASGDQSTATRLQQLLEERMVATELRFPRHALVNAQVRATLLANAGKSDDACAALERGLLPKPRLFWRMVVSNPAFDGMRSTPCFLALLKRFEESVASERARVDEMRRTGQIPDRSKPNPETVATGLSASGMKP